jgi:hypothetical protein
MAKAPKNELAIKAVIAKIVTDKTSMKTKAIDNIRLKSKTWDFVKNGTGNNVAIQSELMTFWTIISGKQNEDYSPFEMAIIEAQNKEFNSLDILSIRENLIEANYQRIYEIKVN